VQKLRPFRRAHIVHRGAGDGPAFILDRRQRLFLHAIEDTQEKLLVEDLLNHGGDTPFTSKKGTKIVLELGTKCFISRRSQVGRVNSID